MASRAFNEIRAILQAPPSEEAWTRLRRICTRALARHPQEVQEVWMPYLEAGLRRWPDGLRASAQDWLERLCAPDGEGFVLFSLIRHLDLTPVSAVNQTILWQRVHIETLTHLTTGIPIDWAHDWSALRHLTWCEYFSRTFPQPTTAQTPHLTHVTFQNTITEPFNDADPALLAQLTHLTLRYDHDYASVIEGALKTAARLPNLHTLAIHTQHAPDAMSFRAILDHLPEHVAHLELSRNYYEHTPPELLALLPGPLRPFGAPPPLK